VKQEVYDAVIERSGSRCEAEVEVLPSLWMGCAKPATEVHHMLPKSRGGRILDDYGETSHLINLCQEHHMQAHSRKDADGLMIDGSVTWDKLNHRPIYKGTDTILSKKYTHTSG
jgi:hypothetical protein